MTIKVKTIPDHTAVRTALWRALHLEIDSKPPIFNDELGAILVGEKDWQKRPDMNPDFSMQMRASIVARARLIEDLLEEKIASRGIDQYVILGSGLDTFAERRPELASKIQIYEIDQTESLLWKKNRLIETGLIIPTSLHFVPVDFEAGESWFDSLINHGFDLNKPSLFVSTGVSMYLSKEANLDLLKQIKKIKAETILAMTFMQSPHFLDEKERNILEFVMKKASDAGTPFLSLYSPNEILAITSKLGFKNSKCIFGKDLLSKYFDKRMDKLDPGNAEAFIIIEN